MLCRQRVRAYNRSIVNAISSGPISTPHNLYGRYKLYQANYTVCWWCGSLWSQSIGTIHLFHTDSPLRKRKRVQKEISMQSSIGTRRDYFMSYLCYMRRYNALYAGYPNKSVCRAVTVRTTTKRLCRYPDCC